MDFYEIIITVYLTRAVHYTEVNELISRNINRAMLLDPKLAEKHAQNSFKLYVYSGFFPVEKEKVYNSGKVYIFRLRCLERDFAVKIKQFLPQAAEDLKVLSAELKVQRYRLINELYTITPAVATVDGRYWVRGDDIGLLQSRIEINLLKKYRQFFNENLELNSSIIQRIEILNNKPIALKYKGGKLIGNKFKILINTDTNSQKLAFIALAAGLLEKNSSNGMGFCSAR